MPNDGDGRSATAFLDWRSVALVPSVSTVNASSSPLSLICLFWGINLYRHCIQFAALVAYISLLATLEYILPGKRIAGALLADGTRLTYKCNGLLSLLALLLFLGLSVSPAVVAERGLEFLVTTFLLCVLVSLITFICGRRSSSKAASFKPHLSGNLLNDWWLGVQLNPQFLGFDLKFLWTKAGMIGWLLINLSIAAKQIQLDGSLSFSMALYQFFSAIYVLDYFWHEEYMTSTWDIIAENFGFMLIFGDLVWIPFTFSIQGWWLLRNKLELTWTAAVANVFVFIIGYVLFRGANKQKHIFKKNPKALIWGQPPKLIGGKLLASGYWGIARHCNYLGDLLLALSFSLPCGTRSVIPYFYPIYLFILLIWRERRDEARCREKYKEVWVDYCNIVPWRIFPGIY